MLLNADLFRLLYYNTNSIILYRESLFHNLGVFAYIVQNTLKDRLSDALSDVLYKGEVVENMKKLSSLIKAVLCMAVAAAVILSFAACDLSKEAATADSFKTAAEDLGLTVEDTTGQYAGYEFLTSCTTAGSISGENVEWSVDFMVLDSEANAQSSFETNKDTFESVSGGATTEVNGTNYSSYTKNADGKYMYVCRVDNTLVYANVDSEYKDAASALIQAIGY